MTLTACRTAVPRLSLIAWGQMKINSSELLTSPQAPCIAMRNHFICLCSFLVISADWTNSGPPDCVLRAGDQKCAILYPTAVSSPRTSEGASRLAPTIMNNYKWSEDGIEYEEMVLVISMTAIKRGSYRPSSKQKPEPATAFRLPSENCHLPVIPPLLPLKPSRISSTLYRSVS